jgi:hypothetical protein
MGEDDLPSLEQCAGVMTALRESHVAQLFFNLNSAADDFPHQVLQGDPWIPSLSELEARLLAGSYQSPRQFRDDVVAVFDIFIIRLKDDPALTARAWANTAEALKSDFLKRIWKCTRAGEMETIERNRQLLRSLVDNPLGECFEHTSTMSIPDPLEVDYFPQKINPRVYY